MKGIPDVCLGYCELETRKGAPRGIQTGICGKYFKYIGDCQKGTVVL